MRISRIVLVSAGIVCLAQNKPAFEVASVKPNPGGEERGFSVDFAPSGRFTARNMSLWILIRTAYKTRDLEMSGGPTWIKTRGFDVQAQPAGTVSRDQALLMLQTLLEDRFQLKWHRESREGQAYALEVADRGPKLPPPGEAANRTLAMGDLDAPNITMDSLSQLLEFVLDRPVVNQTHLSGPFAVKLQWQSEHARAANGGDNASRPSLVTAVQEQLGLKLTSTKLPIEFFVIDSAELPSEN